jgi:hypothetical protein
MEPTADSVRCPLASGSGLCPALTTLDRSKVPVRKKKTMSDDENYTWPPVIPVTESPEEVLSRASHELRHPITAVKGYADLILKEQIDRQEAAECISNLASNMEDVLKAIFDYLQARRTID